ncbi:omega-6 fatty acid desaturase, endoplasmic reticulum isozyme 1 [Fimicolochytrium jonesii]|uniref:omega-6 fatty acid desaturase, endoplasmic reticulum isozyme 1 n=1 Tax=Fimicolochytrium jonesii TaxID=1396493 RepID=UPI0022FEC47E|nr:omega-6 fatty acid desaturase, endoplasmic reticulum isozyme 1 [Fimicolochytrium jonesii]KAI8818790.1 omega-6 fatty acid desaturase, endoplasmic reticulum isozyme 1 [Fimicolochytrium jonesii]
MAGTTTATPTPVARKPTAIAAEDEMLNESIKHEFPGADINIGALRKALPARVFEKSLPISMAYFAFDTVVLAGLFVLYANFFLPERHWSLGLWAAYAVWFNVTGIMLWSLFVVGHDCGHGSFSNHKHVNATVGHLSHGFLLVPFWPWARSHAQHHQFHNHKEKDMSHTWSTPSEEIMGAKFIKNQPFLVPVAYAFLYLLAGLPDGSHFLPWSKLFRNNKERAQCAFSVGVVLTYLVAIRYASGSWTTFNYAYVVPWLAYNTWLYAVTYLQHHTAGTQVYSEKNWTFTTGAVQTVDRVYGYGILDKLIHNITDGHVAHHLMYTSIPHYRLMEATPIVAKVLGPSYRKVEGFPLWEFLKSHWYSTRPILSWLPEKGMWKMKYPSEVAAETKQE